MRSQYFVQHLGDFSASSASARRTASPPTPQRQTGSWRTSIQKLAESPWSRLVPAGSLVWEDGGNEVPYISHLISVSALVYKDNKDSAARRHRRRRPEPRFDRRAFRWCGGRHRARDCTDTSPRPNQARRNPGCCAKPAISTPWPANHWSSLLVTAADKAHTTPATWCWMPGAIQPSGASSMPASMKRLYLLRMHQQLVHRLPKAVGGTAFSVGPQRHPPQQRLSAADSKGSTTETWINTYPERHDH